MANRNANGDDFNPPHVHDETPIQIPRPELAGIFARRFKAAAEQFRRPTPGTRLERLHLGNERYAEYPAVLPGKCGQWLIDANEAGLIGDRHRQLLDLIDWHTQANTPKPDNRESVYMRCAGNLFIDICGGHTITGTLRGEDERGRLIIEDARETGGLLPRLDPSHLKLSEVERYAATCEWLASIIGGGNPAVVPGFASPDELAELFGLGAELTRKRLERHAKRFVDCYIEVDQPKHGEPTRLYRTADVESILKSK